MSVPVAWEQARREVACQLAFHRTRLGCLRYDLQHFQTVTALTGPGSSRCIQHTPTLCSSPPNECVYDMNQDHERAACTGRYHEQTSTCTSGPLLIALASCWCSPAHSPLHIRYHRPTRGLLDHSQTVREWLPPGCARTSSWECAWCRPPVRTSVRCCSTGLCTCSDWSHSQPAGFTTQGTGELQTGEGVCVVASAAATLQV